MRYRGVWSATAVGVLLALVVGGRLVWVHDHSWEWTLRPSATPPKVVVFDRAYRRSDGPPGQPTAADRPVGRTPGGGINLARRPAPYVPTGIGSAAPTACADTP